MTDRTIQIIYASASGNTLFVSQRVYDSVKVRENVEISKVESVNPDQILQEYDHFIFGVSTWEHGEINPYFQPFLARTRQIDLKGNKAAFIGLGDLRYEPILFCKGMEILREAFLESGGEEIITPLKINGDPHDHVEIIDKWIVKLNKSLIHEK